MTETTREQGWSKAKVTATLGAVAAFLAVAGAVAYNVESPAKPTAPLICVYYFHRTVRCPSCEKIEAMTRKTVEEAFADELAAGHMQWRVINIDRPQNKHFEDHYQLPSQSVVLSEERDGKEVRWKNLDKIWDLLYDDAGFVRYIQDEIHVFVQGA